MLDVSFSQSLDGNAGYVCFVSKDGKIVGDAANALDSGNNGFITNAIAVSGIGKKFGQTLLLTAPAPSINHVLLIGLGDKNLNQSCVENLGGMIFGKLEKTCESVAIFADPSICPTCDDVSARIGSGAYLRSWKFNKYKPSDQAKLTKVIVLAADPDAAGKIWTNLKNIAEGVHMARSLVSEPANVLYPESFATYAMKELLPLGVKVSTLNKAQLEALGMGALIGVSQGSKKDPVLLVMQWDGAKDKPLAFVGKGITFDSGGIDLKPEAGMEEMKYDMAGAATVVGLMKAVALNKCPKNIVCVTALAENMPSGGAQKPGDIVKSMSGQTIEVLNTDAEGRLTLADSLWYTQEMFKPELMIDLATLTGAIVVSLGHEYAGLFSNNDDLCASLNKAADLTGEKIWRLPINEYFESTVESDIADLKNLTAKNVRAGSITAACFLKRFVNGVKWAHIDIAGVEATYRDLHVCGAGATGYGVRLLYEFISSYVYSPTPAEDTGNTADPAATPDAQATPADASVDAAAPDNQTPPADAPAADTPPADAGKKGKK